MGNVRELHSKGQRPLFKDQIITVGDLEDFKADLLLNIRNMLSEFKGQSVKKWLKTYEIKKLLGISAGTLQNLRDSGKIPFAKIGGTIYYDRDEIEKMLEEMKKGFQTVKMIPRK